MVSPFSENHLADHESGIGVLRHQPQSWSKGTLVVGWDVASSPLSFAHTQPLERPVRVEGEGGVNVYLIETLVKVSTVKNLPCPVNQRFLGLCHTLVLLANTL